MGGYDIRPKADNYFIDNIGFDNIDNIDNIFNRTVQDCQRNIGDAGATKFTTFF